MGHTDTRLIVHAVFSTKHREAISSEKLLRRLHEYIGGIARAEGATAIIIGGAADHVHLLLQYAAKQSLSHLMRTIKANSSRWMKEQGETGSGWQTGYSAFSVSHDRIERVREYIARQEEHHKVQSFQDELRWFLRTHGIEPDEEHLWED